MLDKKAMLIDKIHPNKQGAFEIASEAFKAITGKSFELTFNDFVKKTNKK